MNIASTEKMMEEDDIEVSIRESLFKRLRKIYQLINDGPFVMDLDSDKVNPHFETLCLIRKIEKQYKYRPLMYVIQDHVSMLKERMVECGLMGYDQLLELKVHKNPIINVYVK